MTSLSSFVDSDAFFAIAVVVALLQFAVGVVQIIGAFIRTIVRLSKGKPLGNLKIYWIMVGVYFFVFLLGFLLYLYMDASSEGASWEATQQKISDMGLLIKLAYFWFFTAWIIAIWYNIKVVFYKEPKKLEQDAQLN